MVPADPRTAALAVQESASKLAWIRISTLLSSVAPQISAANWKALRRCSPTVFPLFCPTGLAGVGSLKPSLGPSTFTTVRVALPKASVELRRKALKKEREIVRTRLDIIIALLPSDDLSSLSRWHFSISRKLPLRDHW